MSKKKLWDIVKLILKIGFTLLLLYLVFRKIELREVKRIFFKSNPLYIFLAFAVYYLAQVVSAWRLLSFFKSLKLNLTFGYNFRLYLLGMFYNTFLPGGVGGDGYKIYVLKKKFNEPTKKIFWALLLDRFSGLWAIGLISTILIILIPKININPFLALAIFSAGTAVYYAVLKKFWSEYVRNFVTAHLKAGVVQSLQLLSVIFILLSQDFQGKFSPYLFTFLVSSLATVVPVSVGGFGIREYVMTHASGIFGMNQALAVFVTITFSILSTIASLPGIWFVYRSREFQALPKEEEEEKIANEIKVFNS
jgi:uncharacterized membrane protein YbhN (UPF0104 family)